MACLKITILFPFVNVICYTAARVIGGAALTSFLEEGPMLTDGPWFTIEPPHFTLKPPAARAIGETSLAERTSEILEKFPGRPERLPDEPLFPIDPPHFTLKPPKPTDPPVSQRSELDLAFIMDTTGSMSPYINNVRQHIKDLVDAIAVSSSTNLRIALIEYRDHRPQDRHFITRIHHFTSSVLTMKSWLNAAQARGGGDGPEAVADALFQATRLSWRPNAAKISVLVTDAPPHGLVSSGDSFPTGCPSKHDPIDIARKLAKKGITLYTVGCEPSIVLYTDFFMALAYLTGGQYIPLSVPQFLTSAVIAGAKEELSLKRFAADVQTEVKKGVSAGGVVNERQIAQSVFTKLKSEGATAQQLLKNNQPLEGATAHAKAIAGAKTLADAKKIFKARPRKPSSGGGLKIPKPRITPTSRSFGSIMSGAGESRRRSSVGRSGIRRKIGGGLEIPTARISSTSRSSGSSMSGAGESRMRSSGERSGIRRMLDGGLEIPTARISATSGSSLLSTSGVGESFTAVEKAISLDQISRLVKLETAKLSA